MQEFKRTNHQTVFSRNAVSGQGDILGKEWMFHVFVAGVEETVRLLYFNK